MSDEKESVSLRAVVGGFIQALREAKHLGDIESAKLLEAYKQEKTLLPFSVPAFTISDVEVELRFAIIGPAEEQKKEGEMADVKINISPAFLKGLEAHHISLMKIKIAPISLRVFED
jgi:hypothetical protein